MKRVPPTVTFVVLGTLLSIFAFQWGRVTAASDASERRETAVVEAVKHAGPAVVNVRGTRGYTRGAGSGVIVHPSGYVITNSHVIQGAATISVRPFQTRKRHPARVVADDPSGDLALLKIAGNRTWPYVSLSPSAEVILGETAIAIGNPHGLGDTITVGVVSAKGRTAAAPNGAKMRNLIQTDAAINSGSSGGPLINLDGELIGVNASMLPRAKGISFAIPADDVLVLLKRVLGRCAPPNPLPPCEAIPPAVSPDRPVPVQRPAPPVVVSVPELAPEPETDPLRPSDVGLIIRDDGRRLVVRQVRPTSPAAKAGVTAGDVLLDVDGFAVEDVNEVRLAFAASRPGRVYAILVRRGMASLRLELAIPR